MTATQTAASPALYSGPFNTVQSLGIDRGNYIAIQSNNPAAAAQYAVENMGFYLVHADSEGRHYLAGHGLDPTRWSILRGSKARSITSPMWCATRTICSSPNNDWLISA